MLFKATYAVLHVFYSEKWLRFSTFHYKTSGTHINGGPSWGKLPRGLKKALLDAQDLYHGYPGSTGKPPHGSRNQCFAGFLVCRFAGLQVCWFCWFAGLQVCRFAGLQVCWFSGLQACWLAGLLVCLLACLQVYRFASKHLHSHSLYHGYPGSISRLPLFTIKWQTSGAHNFWSPSRTLLPRLPLFPIKQLPECRSS